MKDSERMLLSAHFDGEVESPWKEQVEARLASNPEWAAEWDRLTRLRVLLRSVAEPDLSAEKTRVLDAVTHVRPVYRLPAAWLSVAAAALLVVAAGGGFLWGRSSATAPAEVSELKVQVPAQLELKLSGEGQLMMASTLRSSRP